MENTSSPPSMGNTEASQLHWREPQAFLYSQKIHAMVRIIETTAACGPLAAEYIREVYLALVRMEEDGCVGVEDLSKLWECAEPIRRRLTIPLCIATGTTDVHPWQTAMPLSGCYTGYGEDENNAKRARHC